MKNNNYFFLIFVFVSIISCSEYRKESYKSIAEMNAEQSQWIPSFLLSSDLIKKQVYDVFECHDLDTNETWGYFSVIDSNIIMKHTDLSKISSDVFSTKARKRLKKLGGSLSIDNIMKISTEQFSYLLLYNEDINRFYFYGKYK